MLGNVPDVVHRVDSEHWVAEILDQLLDQVWAARDDLAALSAQSGINQIEESEVMPERRLRTQGAKLVDAALLSVPRLPVLRLRNLVLAHHPLYCAGSRESPSGKRRHAERDGDQQLRGKSR